MHFDGGFRGRTGACGSGAWAEVSDERTGVSRRVFRAGWWLDHTAVPGDLTNNVAEYLGALLGLEWLVRTVPPHLRGPLDIFGDSKLVVEQVNRKWAIRKPHLQVYCDRIWAAIPQWGHPVRFTHVRREFNKEADELANRAMDTKHNVVEWSFLDCA